jgi:nitrite reductase (NO-forming)
MERAMSNASFTPRTGIDAGKMAFIGKGGGIDGRVILTLTMHEGDVMQITLINGEGAEHDLVLPDVHASSRRHRVRSQQRPCLPSQQSRQLRVFLAVPDHHEAGTEGLLRVEPAAAPQATPNQAVSISRDRALCHRRCPSAGR